MGQMTGRHYGKVVPLDVPYLSACRPLDMRGQLERVLVTVNAETAWFARAFGINQCGIVASFPFPREAMIFEGHHDLPRDRLRIIHTEYVLIKVAETIVLALIRKVRPTVFLKVGTAHQVPISIRTFTTCLRLYRP